jgi:hypothetical protein
MKDEVVASGFTSIKRLGILLLASGFAAIAMVCPAKHAKLVDGSGQDKVNVAPDFISLKTTEIERSNERIGPWQLS